MAKSWFWQKYVHNIGNELQHVPSWSPAARDLIGTNSSPFFPSLRIRYWHLWRRKATERMTLVGGSVKRQLRRCHCHVLLIDPTTASTTTTATTPSSRPGPAVRPSPGGDACDARLVPVTARSAGRRGPSVRPSCGVSVFEYRRHYPSTAGDAGRLPLGSR